MIKRLATITAALLLGSTSVEAAPRTGTFEDHVILWNAIAATGTQLRLNTNDCFKGQQPDGYYAYDNKGNSEFVVCQDNAKGPSQVDWTENDYDTLRHEAVHLIQDCRDGRRADGRLSPIGSDDEILRLVDATIGREYARQITESYRANGMTDPSDLLTEVEAFAIAASANAANIAELVKQECATY
jgi:hypothetical protein